MFNFLVFLALLTCKVSALESPIVGILSQETFIVKNVLDGEFDSFIGASYVKYLESAGARVMPVWIGQDDDYYKRVINNTNGLLLPGGGTYFNQSKGYGQAAKQLYRLAVQSNERGVRYPLWGICLGMQALAFASAGRDIRVAGVLRHVSTPLEFEEDFRGSRMFARASDEIVNILKAEKVTYNNHKFSLTRACLKEANISDRWRVISTNRDQDGDEFISAMENANHPFYGVQFHPEKNAFEFKEGVGMRHDSKAVEAGQFFANFFVDECRNNKNEFDNEELMKRSLIYNYAPIYTGLKDSSYYEQIYVFKKWEMDEAQLL